MSNNYCNFWLKFSQKLCICPNNKKIVDLISNLFYTSIDQYRKYVGGQHEQRYSTKLP